ncbi:heat shock protein, putative, partial [Eimeria acervulina]
MPFAYCKIVEHFTDAKTVVAFVSVGHSTASVCIAAFTSSGAELLAEVSDPDLGGRDMDVLIAQHFAKIFEKQHGINPLENIKAKLKLEDQAERTKKILSANSETSFAVECLLEDRDISGLITRELFEELCAASFKPALVKLLQQAVAISEVRDGCLVAYACIAFVEAVGGCTRIPWVQRCVSEVFGKEISRTLAGDECVARGCALQAAMASLHFKVKEFDFAEKLWRPICIRWTGEAPVAIASCSQQQEQQQQQQTEGAAVASCQEIELPIGTPTNTMRKITFIRSCPLELHATYKDLEGKTRAADLGNAFFIS